MKKRIPHTRYDLKIRKSDKDVEIGSGIIHLTALMSLLKSLSMIYHRSGDIKIYLSN